MTNSEIHIAALIVTYNRLEFLKEVINAIRNQTLQPSKILVVNNSSTDGTKEWLAGQNDLHVVEQANVGSSGGQYTLFKTAFEMGFEWLWTMDDDVIPRPDCLENLMKNSNENIIRTPVRFTPAGVPYENDCIKFNLRNPFRSMWTRIANETELLSGELPAEGITFEGPLMHRSVVEKIGFPEFGFFIFGDDSEYFIRAKKAGFKTIIISAAKMDRKLNVDDLEKKFTWKHYFIIRNIFAIDVLHASFCVRIIRPIIYYLKWLLRANSGEDRKTVNRAFRDGYFYKRKYPPGN